MMWMWVSFYLALGLVVTGVVADSGITEGVMPSILAGVLWPLTVIWFIMVFTIFRR